tara:strand:+ start:3546 stop:3683 length:138 start_codon:yes stop_codon:yes gene_type:complete
MVNRLLPGFVVGLVVIAGAKRDGKLSLAVRRIERDRLEAEIILRS